MRLKDLSESHVPIDILKDVIKNKVMLFIVICQTQPIIIVLQVPKINVHFVKSFEC